MENKIEKLTNNQSDIPHCKHYVVRKKRYCKMTIKRGEQYCGEHMPSSKDNSFTNTLTNDKKIRVVCPLDRKHTCYAHKLSKHLKICNARQVENIPYIVKGVNCGELIPETGEDGIVNPHSLDNYSVKDIRTVIDKILKLHDDVIQIKIAEKILKHALLEEEIANPELGEKSRKHLYQTSSILGYLQEYKLIQSDTCYIEFGAGKGKLSFWIAKALETLENKGSSVLLVERASHRHKMDNKLDKSTGNVQRIRADISDLVLNNVDTVKKSKQVMGVTKHLCGGATDLALRCLINYQHSGGVVCGTVMAFCCHHRCEWRAYVGKDFFKENDLNCKDFGIMRGIVSWATCGTGFSREKNTNIDDNFYRNDLNSMSDRDKEIGLNRNEKEVVGQKCKALFNYGRLKYLEKNNFNCELYFYVNPSVSLENLCIVAYKNNK